MWESGSKRSGGRDSHAWMWISVTALNGPIVVMFLAFGWIWAGGGNVMYRI
jgi:hypothetical protein